LGDVADLLAERTGTVINFGSLGGETSDIRLFAPRSLTLKGVALGSWNGTGSALTASGQRQILRTTSLVLINRRYC
jgi:hypothetical protein